MNNKIKTLLAAGALVVGVQQAQAIPINGSIKISSDFSHAEVDFVANTVDIVDDSAVVPGNSAVASATGDFSGLIGAKINYADFTYSPLTVVNPLWATVALGVASFDLLSITSIIEAPGLGLLLQGSGIAHLAGFTDTPGKWSFSSTTTGSSFDFSSTATVPDGGTTAMLLGLGFLGAAGLRRKLS